MDIFSRNFMRKILFLSLLVSLPAFAASDDDDDDDDDSSAGLNSSYAKLLDLSSVDDVSTSRLRSNDDDGARYSKIAIPYYTDDYQLGADHYLAVFIKGGFVDVKSDSIPIDNSQFTPRLRAFSIIAGPSFTYRVQDELSLISQLGVGYARLINNSSFSGDGVMRKALRDANLLDWKVDAYVVSPSVGVEYKKGLNSGDVFSVYPHVSFTHVSSFNNHNNDLKISDNSGSYSIKTEYTFTDAFHAFNRNINVVAANKFGGFFGTDYRELGFGFVNETQIAIEVPTAPLFKGKKVRMGVGYLLNDYAQGVSLIFSL